MDSLRVYLSPSRCKIACLYQAQARNRKAREGVLTIEGFTKSCTGNSKSNVFHALSRIH